ncbi:MAG: hypothetical protein LBI33_08070 [Propionibacteriaceae bacterium]|jgi:hypothetical protein|nr:hypothetical protein [Propionibacteriaceae bacterium]
MPTPEHVAARQVLLDALDALYAHLDNLILVGAQAVYLHTGAGTLVVPPMTTDGDLALDTRHLADSPEIARTLIDAGFTPGSNPGHWLGTHDIAIDIMIAPFQSGATSRTARSARIPPHAKSVGRIAPGLEPALIDHAIHRIASFADNDPRVFDLKVANPAALVVAKIIKIAERDQNGRHQPGRLKAKDALDTFRMFQTIETEPLAEGFRSHRTEPESARVSTKALAY